MNTSSVVLEGLSDGSFRLVTEQVLPAEIRSVFGFFADAGQ